MKKLTDKQQTIAIWSVRAIAVVAVVAWTCTFAFAQAQPPEYVIKITPPELDVISEGLQTQPFKQVVPIINKLRQQVIDQQKAFNAPPVPKVEDDK